MDPNEIRTHRARAIPNSSSSDSGNNNVSANHGISSVPSSYNKNQLSKNQSISIKSKIGVEFRRYALNRDEIKNFDAFYKKIETFHQLSAIPFVIFYTDPEDYLLPINNDDNLAKAISSASSNHSNHSTVSIGKHNNTNNYHDPPRPFLKLFIEKKGLFLEYINGSLTGKKKHNFRGFSNFISSNDLSARSRPSIGMPEDFRQVSSIIDVDIVPETCRRVRLVKHGSDKPLGFYIRDGTYKRVTPQGTEKVSGIFISRLVPGGLAESTGLLAVNDEVLEVNGIEVTRGKTLDQVTDMMVANSSNLIITIRPASDHDYSYLHSSSFDVNTNYNNNHHMRTSSLTHINRQDIEPVNNLNQSTTSSTSDHEEDEIKDHLDKL